MVTSGKSAVRSARPASRMFGGGRAVLVTLALMVAGNLLVHRQMFGACWGRTPLNVLKFEMTFDAAAFGGMLRDAGQVAELCREGILRSLVMSDVFFPITYAAFITALFEWVTRRRGIAIERGFPRLLWRLPAAAAVLDVFAENVPLYLAGRLIGDGAGDGGVRALVLLGSTGAVLKFTALVVFLAGLVRLLTGKRA